jgi:hypothetical protein
MEIKLSDNNPLTLRWVNTDTLSVELHKPMGLSGGSLWLAGTALLSAQDLVRLLTESREKFDGEKV